MKSPEEIKQGMISYLRTDIESLSEQNENSEIMGLWNRTQALISAMMMQKMLTDNELEQLHEEVSQAIKKARKNEAGLQSS